MATIRVGILTISDRCSKGVAEDISGRELRTIFTEDPYEVALYAVVPDDRKEISGALKHWSDEGLCDVIVTTGGTGLSPRDVTGEATRKAIDRELPSIASYLTVEGLKHTPFAALSQPVVGLRAHTLIVDLPGSPSGAKDGAVALCALLPHAIDVLYGGCEHPVETVGA